MGEWRGVFTSVRWQLTLCDPIRQVTLRSSEMGFPLKAMSSPLTFNHAVADELQFSCHDQL